MRSGIAIRSLLFALVLLAFSHGASAQIGISVGFGPPLLPIYEQPILPGDGYLWAPGYWGYDYSANDYYWVPGTWVYPPQAGFLWTPGYWGWGGNAYFFNQGYWGPTVGYYGGINYGFGYGGFGYEGGRWEGNRFLYNTSVNRVDTAVIHNTFNAPVSNASENHVSFNGGRGGVEARPTAQQEAYAKEQHVGPVAAQTQHMQAARNNPALFASANQGKPPIAATSKPGEFTTGAVAAKQAGGEYKAPPAINHASELPSHEFNAPNTGNAATNKTFQQQLNALSARQTQDHENLEQKQEQEHQQATQKNYSDSQIQQMEQRHAQQTQQLEQQHTSQNKQMEQRQSSQSSSKQQSNSNSGKPH
jgi:WXXGXW repeat (2 copies)